MRGLTSRREPDRIDPGRGRATGGLLLFLVTPCIGWYLAFTDIAGGDTNLAVSILVPNIVLQIVLLPVYVLIFIGDQIAIDARTVASSVAAFLVLPAIVATALRRIVRHRGGDLDAALAVMAHARRRRHDSRASPAAMLRHISSRIDLLRLPTPTAETNDQR